MRRDLQREGQPRDAAAENEIVELFHRWANKQRNDTAKKIKMTRYLRKSG
jgi:hypothetical protein